MALFEGKTPSERNKMIAAVVFPLIALIFVVRMFFGSSGPTRTANTNSNSRQQQARNQSRQPQAGDVETPQEDIFGTLKPLPDVLPASFGGEAGRNIFAFYARPAGGAPRAGQPGEALPPEATPTPPPPLALASLAPQNTYARTGNFTLIVAGDKFTPATRIYFDGQELPTRYNSPQQLTTTVPASLVANPGARQVVVRTPDNQLYSNQGTFNVIPPPTPTYTYVGLLRRTRSDTAVLKDQRGELYSVREGDIIEGRFRVGGISERSVEVVDKDLNVRHSLPFVESRSAGTAPPSRPVTTLPPQPPPPKPDDSDDEEP